ncbi:MAG TPA: hypothetical protein DCQ53_08855 [Alphaproteobacteria bacterium]|jgi:hypothetical protein|nr:hypothetical protein [Alphaproteobacteria bacterium]
MKSLSADNLEKLTLFWGSLPPEIRKRVLGAAARAAEHDAGQAGLSSLLTLLEQKAQPDPAELKKKRLFAPLVSLTGDPENDPPSRAYFSPTFLNALWSWLDTSMEGGVAGSLPEPDAPAEDWAAIRAETGARICACLDAAEGDRKLESRLVSLWGAGGAETARQAATLLVHHSVLDQAMAGIPEEITDFDPDMCTQMRDAYETVIDTHPEAGVWLLIILMTRLKKTAQIFRAIAKIGRREDDQLISKTDLASVGDAVLKDAEFYATRFRRAPQNLAEAEDAIAGLASFVTVTVGMTREFGIRKDGRWGKTLFALRAQTSGDLEKLFSNTPKVLEAALPVPRKGADRTMQPVEPADEAIIARAEAQLRFLGAAGDWASQAAIGSVQKKAEDGAISALEDCFGHIINILQHSEGETQLLASAGLDVIARLQEALGQDESASLTRRRNAAALAA